MTLAYWLPKRGLSLTEDMAASSPTMLEPEHGKVGVKEGDTRRMIWRQRERKRHSERGEGATTARGAVSHFSPLPPPPNHEMSLSMTTAAPFISFP